MDNKQLLNSMLEIDINHQLTFNKQSQSKQGFCLALNTQLPLNGICGVVGHSGSGKTTLLRIIAGLDKSQAKIKFANKIWQDNNHFVPTHQRAIGYVFQEPSLFEHLTAQGNLDFAIKRSGGKNKTDSQNRLLDQVTEILGIKALLSQYPSQLSGGEKQRVAIARALLIEPELLLMDEPLAALDQDRKNEILSYLENIREAFNLPIIYVSHSMNEIARLADHVVMLNSGKLVAEGDLNTMFSRLDWPIKFNTEPGVVFEAVVVEKDQKWHLNQLCFDEQNTQICRLWINDSGEKLGQKIRLRILASDVSIAISKSTENSILNRLDAKVVEIKKYPKQPTCLLKLKIGSQSIIAKITNKSLHSLNIEEGSQVCAQIKSVAIVQ